MTYLLLALAVLAAGVAYRVGFRRGWQRAVDDIATMRAEAEQRDADDARLAKHQRRVEGGRKAAITRRANAERAS